MERAALPNVRVHADEESASASGAGDDPDGPRFVRCSGVPGSPRDFVLPSGIQTVGELRAYLQQEDKLNNPIQHVRVMQSQNFSRQKHATHEDIYLNTPEADPLPPFSVVNVRIKFEPTYGTGSTQAPQASSSGKPQPRGAFEAKPPKGLHVLEFLLHHTDGLATSTAEQVTTKLAELGLIGSLHQPSSATVHCVALTRHEFAMEQLSSWLRRNFEFCETAEDAQGANRCVLVLQQVSGPAAEKYVAIERLCHGMK